MAEKKKKDSYEDSDDRALPHGRSSDSSRELTRRRSQSEPRRDDTAAQRRKASREPIAEAVPEAAPSARFIHQFIPFVLLIAALFLTACFICAGLVDAGSSVGAIGQALNSFFCGLFGWPAFFLPLVLVNLAIFWRQYVDMGLVPLKLSFSLLIMLVISALVHVVTIDSMGPAGFDIPVLWRDGMLLRGGGVLGGLLGELSYLGLGLLGSMIILIPGIGVLLMFLFGTTPRGIWLFIRYKAKRMSDRRRARRAAEEDDGEDDVREQKRDARRERSQQRREARQREKEAARRRRHEILRAKSDSEDDTVFSEGHEVIVGGHEKEEKGDKTGEKTPSTPARSGSIPLPSDGTDPTEAPREGSIKLTPAEPEPTPTPEPEIIPLKPAEDSEPVPETPKKAEKSSTQVVEPVRRGGDSRYAEGLKNDPDFNDLTDIINGKTAPSGGETCGTVKADPQRPKRASKADDAAVEAMGMITDTDDISDLMDTDEEPVDEKQTEYVFPPIDLLVKDPGSNDDFAAELQDNAKRLMDTLRSFNVRIKEINYSRGPTITRYELRPDDGVRIRSIANLVDDIALSLATAGVRIEAPIPGKSAVGVEVPNKHQATVYLRTLIESQTFVDSPSRLAVCLGEDVAGKPIYFNIDKMPHMLIAGATGMGKSVCINSIIVSILYKAKPDEVKLILVDPKKVEFNIYKDIPHLYVPVVSDPKKAAGVLATAVAEMERRFELIEGVNVRDINNYNKLAESDPELEPLPRIVIIIDELADLMMTASDDVETAICRLAQKARAAGIHLIIGTQRPSVDVITGLIKANIPSRIACKVSSQVDSRTIIDIGGAEKLIGRGDMLFAPVGAMKPIRVQGAFVGDMEVENIVEFIKQNNSEAHYDDEFIRRIEEEAAKCGNKKGGAAAANIEDVDGEAVDPKLRDAIELAIECGKISTSLMQRRLEVGYGRGAKILDQMEKLGYISAPDGNKPRRVLITKEQFMEKVINDDIEG